MKKTRNWIVDCASLACLLYGAAVLPAAATPVVISNGYVQAGVSDYGTLGSNSTASPGILYDPTGGGSYGSNDILRPGTPFEGFYVTANDPSKTCSLYGTAGYCQYGNNHGGSVFATTFPFPTGPTLTSASSATWSAVSLDGTLGVTHTYSLHTVGSSSVIAISTMLTALTGSLNQVEFLRTLDPDPDYINYGTYNTNNTLPSNDQACATGTNTGQTVCIASNSPFAHLAGVSKYWSRLPAAYLGGLNDGNGDFAIGLGFQLGNFAQGESKTVCYSYVLGPSLSAAAADTACRAVPEPGTLPMTTLASALAVLGVAAGRRRQARGAVPPAA